MKYKILISVRRAMNTQKNVIVYITQIKGDWENQQL